ARVGRGRRFGSAEAGKAGNADGCRARAFAASSSGSGAVMGWLLGQAPVLVDEPAQGGALLGRVVRQPRAMRALALGVGVAELGQDRCEHLLPVAEEPVLL